MKSILVTILFLWLSLYFYAQSKTDSLQVVSLEEVTISDNTNLLKSFNAADTINANSIDVANSLQQQSNFYVNTSSPNGLATLSLNGIAAKSIPIIWQNHNLNSVMNGITDLNLLDNFLFNQLEVRYADSFEQAGWGGSAATVELRDQHNSTVQMQHQLGSFGKQKIGLAYNQQYQNVKNTAKFFYTKADNDFIIFHPQANKQKQTNNAIKAWGILNNTNFALNNKHIFDVNLWWQNTNREIATALFASNNKSSQIDSTFRINLAWQYEPLKLKASVAYFNELNAYNNPQLSIKGIHKTTALKGYVAHHKKINNVFILNNSISYNYFRANSTNFESDEIRNSVLLKSVLLYQFIKIPLKLKADVVLDFTDNQLLPVRPGIYALYNFNSYLKIGAQLSRHYNLPTFNDLYWVPGGNANLLPENGYVSNLHFTYNNENKLFKFSLISNSVNNEIVWLPGLAYWSPENINQLRSKGFSVKAKQLFSINTQNKIAATFNYNYLEAKNIEDNNERNFQLIYRPKHKASINFTYHIKEKIQLNYSHQITSKRFTTTDNINSVPSFNTANFSANYKVKINKAKLHIEASVLNIFNTYYEITANRPMPGTHFLITTNLNFK